MQRMSSRVRQSPCGASGFGLASSALLLGGRSFLCVIPMAFAQTSTTGLLKGQVTDPPAEP